MKNDYTIGSPGGIFSSVGWRPTQWCCFFQVDGFPPVHFRCAGLRCTVGPNGENPPKNSWLILRFCLPQFNKFWIWSADRKQKSAETCLKKIVKSHQVNLNLADFIYSKPQCSELGTRLLRFVDQERLALFAFPPCCRTFFIILHGHRFVF